ncbi:hypothetical protein K2173_002419 [Erythroxylum novogranatense]|uniref:HTH myb-type domain-containing protein n=1 Tax=Erythroxylum novogranatense TaxID=1862640 RepID=A0AAV8T9W3_9ROSI|nr:hypothetical protein K2173_002419 [Erythroxylum novogranatense]
MEMDALPPPELSLDFRPTFVPKTITDFLQEVSVIRDVSDKASRVDGFVKVLEDEIRKINAFKGELPLCVLLLNDAVLFLRNEAVQFTESKSKPVLEEFIPLKKKCDNNENDQMKKEDSRDKKNWMSSVQLWNGDDPTSSGKTIFDSKTNSRRENKTSKKGNLFGNEHAFQTCKNRSETRAYIPFKAYSGLSKKDGSDKETVPDLSLLTPGTKNLREESGSTDSRFSCSRTVSSSAPNSHSNIRNSTQSSQQQSARKQRRCWSPDLHRRFVNALHQLGGCQAATPKQIRELIQVDGLTNDEVKSHLQKYRLHSRRIPPASAGSAKQSLAVSGGF